MTDLIERTKMRLERMIDEKKAQIASRQEDLQEILSTGRLHVWSATEAEFTKLRVELELLEYLMKNELYVLLNPEEPTND